MPSVMKKLFGSSKTKRAGGKEVKGAEQDASTSAGVKRHRETTAQVRRSLHPGAGDVPWWS
jgi:hypothetical protein